MLVLKLDKHKSSQTEREGWMNSIWIWIPKENTSMVYENTKN